MASYLTHTSAAADSGPLGRIPAALLPAYLAASSSDQDVALEQASSDIDNAIVYQGRKYDLAQPLMFPRIAYRGTGRLNDFGMPVPAFVIPGAGDVVWDWYWDEAGGFQNGQVIVPWDVLKACLFQANFILDGGAEARLEDQHAGVTDSGASGARESWARQSENRGLQSGLCRRAYQLIEKYRAVSGRLM